MAERGETVHVIGERWEGAAKRTEHLCDGRLIVHRIAPEDAVLYPELSQGGDAQETVSGMVKCPFPPQWFSWVAAGLAERLVEQEGIDVIEAQEWEAPLHYFLLRRSMGLGPDGTPPCITHLHSPTEFIFQHNGWSLARPDYVPMKRMEDHVIRAADGWLCPSRFLADQATGHYGLDGPVEVIPLPLGTTKKIERRAAKWKSGSIVFCGRLEPRKGIIEFVEAAVSIAREMPELRFDFIGSDTEYDDRTNVGEVLNEMIPPELKRNFRFHGSKPRAKLLKMLGDARIAVVPSRWENFPNTCLEAMCSGLPVLASRNGGMAEMIEHGVTGWLAADGAEPLADRLADALRIAVKTPAEQLRQMGDAAAISIHRLCDNDAIVARHVAYREEIRRKGATRSLHPADAPLSYPDVSASELVPDTTGRYEIQGFTSVLSLPLRDQAKIWLLALRRPDWAVRWLYWRGKSFMESKWGADARH
jgi:glycosyltransferase involved in cell wall biosynthesis